MADAILEKNLSNLEWTCPKNPDLLRWADELINELLPNPEKKESIVKEQEFLMRNLQVMFRPEEKKSTTIEAACDELRSAFQPFSEIQSFFEKMLSNAESDPEATKQILQKLSFSLISAIALLQHLDGSIPTNSVQTVLANQPEKMLPFLASLATFVRWVATIIPTERKDGFWGGVVGGFLMDTIRLFSIYREKYPLPIEVSEVEENEEKDVGDRQDVCKLQKAYDELVEVTKLVYRKFEGMSGGWSPSSSGPCNQGHHHHPGGECPAGILGLQNI
mmetsp:Transcript_3235/g.4642  ORF Transcript_3235/g.4642 Transcript_3235/m.4642 type:complete len:276 (-) Transcript_3235:98-925(-)|eukprot:CAMPEP_0175113088 /NCGR_PEP_ID=MMETSP0086_2-20121207/15932_1 /TAXON_ID=136419 /ORGANISM="Unknown Unknown, Strain D1" /LENGTH=275 /DNA_ID=CAMNT_0016392239 /DNA_START=10 /DNA_END=837 /DNA_ORIENTATION=-